MNTTQTGRPGRSIPSIEFLDPSNVNRGWEGVVKIHGRGFVSGAFAFFNEVDAKTIFTSDELLNAHIKGDITNSTGTKKVKVHNGDGALSN